MRPPSTASDSARPTNVRWFIFFLACASSALLYLHRYSWGVIKPDILKENPDLTDLQIGWLDSAFTVTYAIGQVPCGLASDILGPRLILTSSVFLWSAMVAGTALIHGYWMLALVRAVFGLSQAGTYPILGQLTRFWFPRQIRTVVQGTITAMGRLGGAAASVVVATLLMGLLGLSWRTALLVLAVPGLVLAAAVWYSVRSSPGQHPWTNTEEQKLIAGMDTLPETSRKAAAEPDGSHDTGLSISFQFKPAAVVTFVMLLFYSFVSTFADMLYVNWIPTFLVQGRGLDFRLMGLLATLPLLGGAAGGVVGGILNDSLYRWTGNRRWSRSGVACTGKLLAALFMASSLWTADGLVAMIALLACKFFGDWSQPTQWGTITDIGGRASATVFGVVNTVGNIGAVVAGPVMGYWKQQYGWEGLFLSVAVIYVVAALAWLFIDCTRKLVN